jgi:glycosyltransferase involved in cell wall biosynthesis
MYLDQKVIVVLPAYNAAKTLEATYSEIPFDIVDEVILCDDGSTDHTAKIAESLQIDNIIQHKTNKGYGANQKSLYNMALENGADIIIMLHPDYQYTPKLISALVSLIGQQVFSVALGSRILGKGALKGGMPLYKYVANRGLTFFQNLMAGQKLSEYHTGYRAYRREVLLKIRFEENSDDFVFDNEVLAQIIDAGFEIGEISCPARYDANSSSINFKRSTIYGLGVLRVSVMHFLQRFGLASFKMFRSK